MREHGYARYRLDGCRCYVCGLARSMYDERRTKMMTAGTWQPFVPIEQTREHVLAMMEIGMGARQIALLADVDRKLVRDIARGRRQDPGRGNPPMTKIRKETAAKILAVPMDQLAAADGAYINATMTWTRIEALLEAGWTKARIAREALGTQRPVLQLRRDRVTVANARKIQQYVELHLGDSSVGDDAVPDDDPDWVELERRKGA